MNSLKKEIFNKTVSISIIILFSFGTLITYSLYRTNLELTESILEQENLALNNAVRSHFIKIRNYVEALSSLSIIRNAINLSSSEKEQVLEIFRAFKNSDKDIRYIYAGYRDGSILIDNWTPPRNFDPRIRPWYLSAIKAYPEISAGIPYREIKTKEWLISISKAMVDSRGKISGVISIDSSIEGIISALRKQTRGFRTIQNYIIDKNGKVLISKNKSLLGRRISRIIILPNNLIKSQGIVCFSSSSGVEKLGFYSKIPEFNWIVLTLLNKKEILFQIVNRIAVIIIVVIIITIIIAWKLANTLSKSFLEPLSFLKERVTAIINNENFPVSEYSYPKNEIGEIASAIEKLTKSELYKRNAELKVLSSIDPLTKLFNRRKLYERFKNELEKAKNCKTTFSVILIDIDHFKQINDTFGHLKGDAVLVELSRLILSSIRNKDVAGRWGGEEFLIICPETNLNQAKEIAERIRKSVEKYKFPIPRRVTVSIGVQTFSGETDIDELLTKVDKKLYIAKRMGRNRVIS